MYDNCCHLYFIHELHCLNDANCLPLGDLVSLLAEGGLSRGGGSVEAACHGGCHLHTCWTLDHTA
jgi:hypothetical protein